MPKVTYSYGDAPHDLQTLNPVCNCESVQNMNAIISLSHVKWAYIKGVFTFAAP